MKNRVSEHEMLLHTAGGAISSGDIVVVGNRLGIAQKTVASGEQVALHLHGVFRYTKAADTISQGDKLYYDSGNDRLTTSATSNLYAGIASKAAAGGDADVEFVLNFGAAADAAS